MRHWHRRGSDVVHALRSEKAEKKGDVARREELEPPAPQANSAGAQLGWDADDQRPSRLCTAPLNSPSHHVCTTHLTVCFPRGCAAAGAPSLAEDAAASASSSAVGLISRLAHPLASMQQVLQAKSLSPGRSQTPIRLRASAREPRGGAEAVSCALAGSRHAPSSAAAAAHRSLPAARGQPAPRFGLGVADHQRERHLCELCR